MIRAAQARRLLAALLFVPAPSLFGADPAIVKSEFIYETAPFPECHASTIVETPRGIMAAWFGGTRERHPDVGIWTSHYSDAKWSAPVEVANGMQADGTRSPTWNPVLFQPANGPLLLFYKVGPDPEHWWGMSISSRDGGETWSPPHRLPDGILGPIKNKPIQLSNGDFLSPTSDEAHGWRVYFERSSDGGKTWSASPPINDGMSVSAIQPSVLIHQDGKLEAVGRTRQGKVFEVWSTNHGLTWGGMILGMLPNPNSGTDAVSLADGRQLIVYNHADGPAAGQWSGPRSPLNVAVSDDGTTWKAALVLEEEPDAEFSYPAVIQARDGLVHITYTWKRKRIRHVVIDPARLTLRPIVSGQWPR